MNPLFSQYVLIMIATAMICALIAAYVLFFRRNSSEAFPLILLLSGIVEWIITALLGLLDQEFSHKILWAKIEYVGVVSVPLMVLVYVLRHSGFKQQLTIKQLAWLALIPAATLILAWTNEYHGLVWARYVPYRENGLTLSDKTYGPAFWIYWGYSYLVLLAATIIAVRSIIISAKIFRWQNALILTGILAPWIGNLLYVLKLNPFGSLDLTPLAFSITGVMVAIGMFRWRLFDIKPIAQSVVIARMADGLLILDVQGRIVDANLAAQAILGSDLQKLIGKDLEQIIPAWRPPGNRTGQVNGKSIELTFEKEGEKRDYELTDSPFYEKQGTMQGTIIFLHDVTKRKRLEKELEETEQKHAELLLQQAENKYAVLYQNMSVGVMYRNADGKVTDMNPAAERILGVKLAQIRGLASMQSHPKTIHEDGSPFPAEEHPSMVALKTGKPLRDQVMGVYFPNEKNYHWVVINAMPQFKNGEEKPYQVFVTIEDITGRKRAEEEIKWRAKNLQAVNELAIALAGAPSTVDLFDVVTEKLRAIIDAVAISISIYDPQSRDLVAKQIALRDPILSKLNQLLGQNIIGMRFPVSANLLERMLTETASVAGDLTETTFGVIPRPIGVAVQKAFGVREFLGLALCHGDEFIGTMVIAMGQDQPALPLDVLRVIANIISVSLQRKRAEDALARLNVELEGRVTERTAELQATILELQQAKAEAEAANRAKSEFLSRMSHELRTPLNAILGFAQLMDMSKADPLTPTQSERTQRILEGGRHLLDLVNEVLDIARIETGRYQISLQVVDVISIVNETFPLVATLSEQNNISVQFRNETAHDVSASADPLRLRQVLLNLLSNAIKFNREGGAVTVVCQAAGDDRLRLLVRDTGIGIPQEKMHLLFQPFERLGAEKNGVEGTGLGLALSKRLVEAMRGKIGVESVVGEGSTFWIELPRQ